MRFLVLGGAGFIGSTLSRELSKTGQVTVIDRLVHQKSKSFVIELDNLGVNFVNEDINKINFLATHFTENDYDAIYHLAANSDIRPDFNKGSRNLDFYDTLGTTLTLVEALKQNPAKKVIFASTSAIFGLRGDYVDEKTHKHSTLEPISDYGLAKLSSEHILNSAFHSELINQLEIVRFPNVIGVNPTHGILFDFINKIALDNSVLEVLGNGSQSKPYINSSQLVDILLRIGQEDKFKSVNFHNVGPSDTCSVKEIVEIFLEIFSPTTVAEFEDKPNGWVGDVPHYSFNSEKYSEILPKSSVAVRNAIKDQFAIERKLRN